jgi:hypothetical protein
MNEQYLYLHSYITLKNWGLHVSTPVLSSDTDNDDDDDDATGVEIFGNFQFFNAIKYVNTKTVHLFVRY